MRFALSCLMHVLHSQIETVTLQCLCCVWYYATQHASQYRIPFCDICNFIGLPSCSWSKSNQMWVKFHLWPSKQPCIFCIELQSSDSAICSVLSSSALAWVEVELACERLKESEIYRANVFFHNFSITFNTLHSAWRPLFKRWHSLIIHLTESKTKIFLLNLLLNSFFFFFYVYFVLPFWNQNGEAIRTIFDEQNKSS